MKLLKFKEEEAAEVVAPDNKSAADGRKLLNAGFADFAVDEGTAAAAVDKSLLKPSRRLFFFDGGWSSSSFSWLSFSSTSSSSSSSSEDELDM